MLLPRPSAQSALNHIIYKPVPIGAWPVAQQSPIATSALDSIMVILPVTNVRAIICSWLNNAMPVPASGTIVSHALLLAHAVFAS